MQRTCSGTDKGLHCYVIRVETETGSTDERIDPTEHPELQSKAIGTTCYCGATFDDDEQFITWPHLNKAEFRAARA